MDAHPLIDNDLHDRLEVIGHGPDLMDSLYIFFVVPPFPI